MVVVSSSERVTVALSPAQRIVVAVDQSNSAHAALEWAAAEAVTRQCTLIRVACPTVPDDAVLAEVVGAELLIVGASNSGAGLRWLFGSVPPTAARRSSCPVVVVRGGRRGALRRIVVGVDSSNASAAALDWAISEANLHVADIEVMHSWKHPDGAPRSMRGSDLLRAGAGCVVDIAVRYCRQRTRQSVRGSVAEGEAAAVLAAASSHADLLVVGSRGCSGFKTLLFGSVALSVADHADCPVVVIHPRLR